MFDQLKLIAFDMDDTMVAFDLVTEKSWHQVCRAYHSKNSHLDYHHFYQTIMEVNSWYWSDKERHKIGRNDIWGFRRTILKDAFKRMGITKEEDAICLADQYSTVRIENMYLLKDIYQTLENARKKYKVVMITNGSTVEQRTKIEKFNFLPYFEHIFIEQEMGYGKPDSRVFETVMQKFEVKPHQCMMLGDNPEWDVIAPGKLGWKTAFVNTRKIQYRFEDYQPDFIWEHAAEINQFIS